MKTQREDSVIVEDLIKLRDELYEKMSLKKNYDSNGLFSFPEIQEYFHKINSCIYRGYPNPD